MTEPTIVLIVDDLAERLETFQETVSSINHTWQCRLVSSSRALRLLDEGATSNGADGRFDWADVAFVLTDTVDSAPDRAALTMPYAGIELATRLLAREEGPTRIIGYSYWANAEHNPAMRVAWEAVGCPFLDLSLLDRDGLDALLSDEEHQLVLADRMCAKASEDDWRHVGLRPPSEGGDPDRLGDALRLALTEEGRTPDCRGSLWELIARVPVEEQAAHNAREWAKAHIGPKLGPPPDADRWSFPAIAYVLRSLAGFRVDGR